jgi:hypothetical protein
MDNGPGRPGEMRIFIDIIIYHRASAKCKRIATKMMGNKHGRPGIRREAAEIGTEGCQNL